MKPTEFKKIIKEAVKEAIHEELKDIILEAVKSPKSTSIGVGSAGVVNENIIPSSEKRQRYMEVLNQTAGLDPEMGTISMTSANVFRPMAMNTAAEGSSLPPGEVDMSQIMGLLSNK